MQGRPSLVARLLVSIFLKYRLKLMTMMWDSAHYLQSIGWSNVSATLLRPFEKNLLLAPLGNDGKHRLQSIHIRTVEIMRL